MEMERHLHRHLLLLPAPSVQNTRYWVSTSKAYSGERYEAQLPVWTVSLDGSLINVVQKAVENAFWPVRGGQ